MGRTEVPCEYYETIVLPHYVCMYVCMYCTYIADTEVQVLRLNPLCVV